MAAEKWVFLIKKNLNLPVSLFVLIAITDALIAIASFVMYGRARMRQQEQKEKYYLQIHYTSLFILLLLGIVFMFYMVETAD